ncbi:Fe-S cluster assembly ATPase SufC [bacterium]|nr:Fe-S cluster assembly ATPase SufC [bacterium]
MLKIEGLRASIEDKEILRGVDLEIPAGAVHGIMGPNGSGKSTLVKVLAGDPAYTVTEGSVSYKGMDLLEMEPDERARSGVFLAFQYPMEIPGVSIANFLRAAVNSIRGPENELPTFQFYALLQDKLRELQLDEFWGNRYVNEGFSGGEKKRNEILQMLLLEPGLCLLDETDSGLDVDALKIVSDGVNRMRSPERSMLIVTHYMRLLDYIAPDRCHIMLDGRIVQSGDIELARRIDSEGYEFIRTGVAETNV